MTEFWWTEKKSQTKIWKGVDFVDFFLQNELKLFFSDLLFSKKKGISDVALDAIFGQNSGLTP